VLDRTFLGDRVRLTLEAFGDPSLVASLPAADGAAVTPGGIVTLTCRAADCLTLTR